MSTTWRAWLLPVLVIASVTACAADDDDDDERFAVDGGALDGGDPAADCTSDQDCSQGEHCAWVFSNGLHQRCMPCTTTACPTSPGCYSQSQLCNGTANCVDGFDEQGCTNVCQGVRDGMCDPTLHGETCANCPADCGCDRLGPNDSVCVTSDGEPRCENPHGSVERCGDGMCNGFESAVTCLDDCHANNGVCEADRYEENCQNTYGDCQCPYGWTCENGEDGCCNPQTGDCCGCGDGNCGCAGMETRNNCPDDCDKQFCQDDECDAGLGENCFTCDDCACEGGSYCDANSLVCKSCDECGDDCPDACGSGTSSSSGGDGGGDEGPCGTDPCCGDPCCGDPCCGDPCCGDPCCGDPCCGDPCCGDPCCGDPCCGDPCCGDPFCGGGSVCGDGFCDADEGCSTCAWDCCAGGGCLGDFECGDYGFCDGTGWCCSWFDGDYCWLEE